MNVLTIADQTMTGDVMYELVIKFDTPTITAQELITRRVRTEVYAYNQKAEHAINPVSLIIPTDQERILNGKPTVRKFIDPDKQVQIALDAFKNNGFFILVDDRQLTKLDDTITITPDTKVNFIKLTPLVGG
ncbi:hypothetical protein [Moraxella sp. VT-16-12]|uniref:hypothetical protein n=1 Tax=Moraxella sp. VT-16-12 TaxID=2014877 RepID=UPI000B7C6505|nr:hypothetical protein [Moraxella sp. VT-16-12]TWV82363.1 hypothetical protein CEW93_005510 [Moraxella sp. VT-16-12]